MSERMFVTGLLVGIASLVLFAAIGISLERAHYEYWEPTSVAVGLSVSLAAIAGFMCGDSYD